MVCFVSAFYSIVTHFFIEVELTHHKIHHFKAHNSVLLSIFLRL